VAARRAGFEVADLDWAPEIGPLCTFNCDIMAWDYKAEYPNPAGVFDVIWASPPCQAYSQQGQNLEADMAAADAVICRVIEIVEYFSPVVWWVENPWGGSSSMCNRHFDRLSNAGCVMKVVSYCKYGCDYRKWTSIFTNDSEWRTKPKCSSRSPCEHLERRARSGVRQCHPRRVGMGGWPPPSRELQVRVRDAAELESVAPGLVAEAVNRAIALLQDP
jgi:hypothetical protein